MSYQWNPPQKIRLFQTFSDYILCQVMDIVDITPPVRYSFEERSAARLGLSKSRFFLVLGLGAEGFGTYENPLPATLATCSKPNVALRVVTLESGRKGGQKDWFRNKEKTRVLLELRGRHSPKSSITTANRVVSAIGSLFTYVHHTTYADLSPYQIPKELVRGTAVNVAELEELEARTGLFPYPTTLLDRLVSCVIIAETHTATIFFLLPLVLQNEVLFNACAFFLSCCSEFSFTDGVVREVLDEPRRGPENEIERLALEHVVLQSFRTVEAIVGEPGKNEKRFHERLKAWNLQPNERVGFPGRHKRRLEDRIRWLQDARDSAAAHGKRRRSNPFTLLEAMEAQHLAHSVLERAIWWKAESLGREGDESEVAFLLEEMFPYNPGWARDRKLFRGKRAVDLVRTPGGLTRVLRYQHRTDFQDFQRRSSKKPAGSQLDA